MYAEPLATLAQKVDPRWVALPLVDVQNDFLAEGGAMDRTGATVARMRPAADCLAHVLAAARRAGVPPIFVRNVYNTAGGQYLSPTWLEQARRRWNGRYVDVPVCAEGSWGGDFYGDVRPLPGEAVVTKYRFSAFGDTDLDLVLRSLGRRTLVVGGVVTHVCVESTVRDAFFRDYYNVILADGVASWDETLHRHSLQVMDWGFGEVACADDVLTLWGEGHG